MRQRILAMSTSSRNEILLSTFESQYLVGAASPRGHSISNVSSGRAAAALIGAVRTRTRAKRERSGSAEPSRHVMVRQAGDAGTQRAVGAVACIHQHDTGRDARRQGGANLRQRDLRLGLESDRLG